ncbi:MAG: helix-turn-helix transcriptional regulator [Candidatus Dadabacteria bacterium]|nr:helix-turn-helix transcriptional regulator [Candidatus Dadabacteria bacterium]MCZ6469158.1 helix-turn-helix transcriptional regulator [Candidatus Dadabacteria bacterium]MCZ6555680.1 helix-turn-helix transcriptional regulator [Candidatus Dadabacteria bacterium]MCZ6685026.1 helix-turn-helix transcriptional regulator [Candidatus Dadabacteria bacterium]MCZ6864608.1 helix-turn-helix transcriptional regulator [Candidatus Dadabacteria bacterium]
MRFGDYLKSKRKQRNITQEELARSLKVSSVFVHQLETGKVDAPSIERCQQMAVVLEIEIDELWTVARKERLKRFMEKEEIEQESFEVLTETEKALINLYRSLDNDMRRDFGGMIFMLLRHTKDQGVQEILEEFMKKCA